MDKIVEQNGKRYRFADPDETASTFWVVDVNMTPKMINVPVPDTDSGLEVNSVYLWEEEKSIKGLVGDDVIFEAGSRSKAFKELLEYARCKPNVTITEKQGDYGTYYWVRLRFPVVLAD